MFLHYLRLIASVLTLAAGLYFLLVPPPLPVVGSVFIAITLMLWLPWRGFFLTYVYFHYKKKEGLNKNLSLLSEIVPALMCYSHHRPAHSAHPVRTENSIRLMALNAFEPNNVIAPKADILLEADADIVAVSEVNNNWTLALRNLKHVYPHQKITLASDSINKYNMLLLSKYPAKVIKTQAAGRLVHYQITTPQEDIYLVQVHPTAPFTPKRTKLRNRTLKTLANIKTDLPLIIMGDFNCVPWHKMVREIISKQQLRLAGLPEPTYPSQQKLNTQRTINIRPFAPLDYILIPKDATLLNQRTYKVPETDHLAVSACIELKECHHKATKVKNL